MDGVAGIEPALTGPKPVVLPLDDTPVSECLVAETGFEPVTFGL